MSPHRHRRNTTSLIVACVVAFLWATAVSTASRGTLSPWAVEPWPHARAETPARSEAHVPLPAMSRSVEVIRNDAPIWFTTGATARRGSAQLGARLPLIARRRGQAACAGAWYLVGPQSWICEAEVRLSGWPPTNSTPAPRNSGLPYDYYFVGADGSFGYANLRLAEEGVPDSQLEPGFAVAVRHIDSKPNGERYGLTTHGLWVPLRDLNPAHPTSFGGVRLDGPLDVAWTFQARTPAHSKPGRRIPGSAVPRLSVLRVIGTEFVHGVQWVQAADQRWFRASHLRIPVITEPPPELLSSERWLHVNTQSQTLVAYRGSRPVFATLVSTGKGDEETPSATPKGQFRIWVKLRTTDMTNLEDEYANRYYAIEEVPWVMFFQQGYGLHGAFWHDSFGTRRSHGCINLSPKDAHFLFEWAGPLLPPGWHAVHPTRYDRGSMVVVD